MKHSLFALGLILSLSTLTACADETAPANTAAAPAVVGTQAVETQATETPATETSATETPQAPEDDLPDGVADRLRDALARLLPERQIDRIRRTPVENLYEVTNGARVYYITGDGDFLLTGHLIETRNAVDLSAAPIHRAQRELLARFGDDTTINFGAKDLPYELLVFTDIDCPYCRKLHEHIAEYNAAGIRIRYALYPRAGIDSPSGIKARNVWCAPDREAAMTAAKTTGQIETHECDTPIAAHMELASELGVDATPTLITTNADVIPGFVPPARLAALLHANVAPR